MGFLNQKRTLSFAAAVAIAIVSSTGMGIFSPASAEPGLSYDSDHDVVMLPGCDVVVRYNNKTFVTVKAKLLDDTYKPFLKASPEKAVTIFEDYESAKMKAKPEQIYIESYDSGKLGSFGSSRISKDLYATNRVREVQFTNQRVAKETGLTDTSFIGITAVKSFEIAPKNGATPFFMHVFQTPSRLTVFVRQMRADSREFPLDAENIVTQLRIRDTANSVANITFDAAPADASKTPAKEI